MRGNFLDDLTRPRACVLHGRPKKMVAVAYLNGVARFWRPPCVGSGIGGGAFRLHRFLSELVAVSVPRP